MSEKSEKKTRKKWFNKKNLLIAGAVLLSLAVYMGLKMYQQEMSFATQREAVKIQREIMIEHWKAEGLSEEEIGKKLSEQKSEFMNGSERSAFRKIMFTLHRAGGVEPGSGGEGFRH